MASSKSHGLTQKQDLFWREYLIDMNATKAAERAGYSKKSAGMEGARLLANPKIQKLINERIEERKKELEVTQLDVFKALLPILRSNVNDYELDPKTNEVRVKEGVPEEQILALSSIKKTYLANECYRIDFRLWSKTDATRLVMKHLGMLNDKLELNFDEEFRKVIGNVADQYRNKLSDLASRLSSRKEERSRS